LSARAFLEAIGALNVRNRCRLGDGKRSCRDPFSEGRFGTRLVGKALRDALQPTPLGDEFFTGGVDLLQGLRPSITGTGEDEVEK
jgi:hypothetical protein